MTGDQIDNIKRQQQDIDCAHPTTILTRPIVIPHRENACIYATARGQRGVEYGILICDDEYDDAIRRFRELVAQGVSGAEAYHELQGQRRALWTIDARIEVHLGAEFRVYWGEARHTGLRVQHSDRPRITLDRGQTVFFLVAAHPDSDLVEQCMQTPDVLSAQPTMVYQFSEQLRVQHLKQAGRTDCVTVGVFIDVATFQSVDLFRVYYEHEILELLPEIMNKIGDGYDAFSVKLILVELLANAFRHGNVGHPSSKVLLRVSTTEHAAFFEVSDLRNGSERIEASGDVPLYAESGRGLYLVSAYSDRLFVDGCSSTAMLKKTKTREGK